MAKVFFLIFPLILAGLPYSSNAQTVGAIFNSSEASHELTLLSGVQSNDTYLIDNCGHIYNKWSSIYRLGLASYLDASGNLYRGGFVNSQYFNAGGKGGVIEKFSWDGDLLWTYRLANDSLYLHHDFELMPNGNLLVIAWEFLSYSDILAMGRDSARTSVNGFFSEVVFEIDPSDNFNHVWKWRAIDHIVQDRNAALPNYGSLEDNPQLFDINLNLPGNLSPPVDWLHINSIDYNSVLDQILLSCNAIDEIVIVDHSTSISEAASDIGGNANRGGDLLYRWGNPQNYLPSPDLEIQLFNQHDARWISDNGVVTDNVLVFNNGHRIDELNFSTIDEIELHKAGQYNYDFKSNENQQKLDRVWRFNENGLQGLYSKRMSGAKRIKQGRTIVSESDTGRIFEIDESGNVLWTYINPIGTNTIFSQGDIPIGNTIFKSESYEASFFDSSVDLMTDFEKIELDPLDLCEIFEISSIGEGKEINNIDITYENGFIIFFNVGGLNLEIYSTQGQRLYYARGINNEVILDKSRFMSGIYICVLQDPVNGRSKVFKFLI